MLPLAKEQAWGDEQSFPVTLQERVFIKHLEGPLFFGSTARFTETAKQIPATASTLVIRLDKVPYIDQSGLYALETVIIDLVQQQKKVLLVGLEQQPKYMMERIDIIPDLILAAKFLKALKIVYIGCVIMSQTNTSLLYEEKQRFTLWWMWLIILLPLGIGLYGCYVQFFLQTPFGDKPMSNTGLLIFTLFGLAFVYFFFFFG